MVFTDSFSLSIRSVLNVIFFLCKLKSHHSSFNFYVIFIGSDKYVFNSESSDLNSRKLPLLCQHSQRITPKELYERKKQATV